MSASDDEFDEYINELNDEVEAQKRQPKRYLRDLANPLEFLRRRRLPSSITFRKAISY